MSGFTNQERGRAMPFFQGVVDEGAARRENDLKSSITGFYRTLEDQLAFFKTNPSRAHFFRYIFPLQRKLDILASLRQTKNSDLYMKLTPHMNPFEYQKELEAQAAEKAKAATAQGRAQAAEQQRLAQKQEAQKQEAQKQEAQKQEAQRQAAEAQAQAQRQAAEAQAQVEQEMAEFDRQLAEEDAQLTPRARARRNRKSVRNLANLSASNIQGRASVNQVLARGRTLRLANPATSAQALQHASEEEEDIYVAKLSKSNDLKKLNELNTKFVGYTTSAYACMNKFDRMIESLRNGNWTAEEKQRGLQVFRVKHDECRLRWEKAHRVHSVIQSRMAELAAAAREAAAAPAPAAPAPARSPAAAPAAASPGFLARLGAAFLPARADAAPAAAALRDPARAAAAAAPLSPAERAARDAALAAAAANYAHQGLVLPREPGQQYQQLNDSNSNNNSPRAPVVPQEPVMTPEQAAQLAAQAAAGVASAQEELDQLMARQGRLQQALLAPRDQDVDQGVQQATDELIAHAAAQQAEARRIQPAAEEVQEVNNQVRNAMARVNNISAQLQRAATLRKGGRKRTRKHKSSKKHKKHSRKYRR